MARVTQCNGIASRCHQAHGQRILQQINADLEQNNAWLLGEDFQGNPIANIDRFKQTGIGALFDFPFYYALTNSVCDGQSFEEIASILSLDSYYPDGSHLVRFLDNHDLPRILSRCNDDKASVLLSEMLIFGLRGTPMISYGTEHWSAGSGEPENRRDMDWNSIDPSHVKYISTLGRIPNTISSSQRRHPPNPPCLSRPTHRLTNVRKRTVYACRQSFYAADGYAH